MAILVPSELQATEVTAWSEILPKESHSGIVGEEARMAFSRFRTCGGAVSSSSCSDDSTLDVTGGEVSSHNWASGSVPAVRSRLGFDGFGFQAQCSSDVLEMELPPPVVPVMCVCTSVVAAFGIVVAK